MQEPQITTPRSRRRILVTGVVQGVGFRPFVYALAGELGLVGSIANTSEGVLIEVEGAAVAIDSFITRVRADAPPLAIVVGVRSSEIAVAGGSRFEIVASRGGAGRTMVSPDVATCADCLTELEDPRDRRYRHPFISCTNCGPRYTVVVDLPYDRATTTMADLPLCALCAAEYADPASRRFHAQTVACADCGPTLRLHRPSEPDVLGATAVAEARRLLTGGAVLAIKGLGGYHLACDATNEFAVAGLRKRKERGDKPFAVMVRDSTQASLIAEVGQAERQLLTCPARPVVLLPRRLDSPLAPAVAPDHPDLGVLLAYTPLHHLLFGLDGDPPGPQVLVMTSGNLAGEPIVTDDEQAIGRLNMLVDAWLTHDRAIHIPCDDSVVRVSDGQLLPVRRSRGYAPLPLALPVEVLPALAVGGDLKNTFCLGADGRAWMSAHIGDMAALATQQALTKAVGQLTALTGVQPEIIVADRHPGYRSVGWARRNPGRLPVRTVQHHHAHIASALAENGHDGSRRVVGIAFDGTGYGDDGAVWGGELLLADYDGYDRGGHLAYVALPGGDAGVRNPCRMALSHLHSAGVGLDERLPCVAACSARELNLICRQLTTGVACLPTSSMGRLFDAMSSLAGVCHRVAYEAEAAMRFEELARPAMSDCGPGYRFHTGDGWPVIANSAPVIAAAAADILAGVPASTVAARFHLAVADLVLRFARAARGQTGLSTVALSGGVFLNVLLTSLCRQRLQDAGHRVLTHQRVPPSDAGLALGQLAVGARKSSTRQGS